MSPTATLLTLLGAGGLAPFATDVQQVKATGTVEVRALAHEVQISGAGKLAAKWKPSGICPRAYAKGADLVLECTTERLHAESGPTGVTVYALRGLPWAASDEPAPELWFQPETVGLGGPCPGTTPAGKAECLLEEGRFEEARTQLNLALETPNRDYAAVRFADLALADDQPVSAMEWLEKAGRSGDWGRLASVRQCELSGRCLDGATRDAMFDAAGMAAPLRTELKLRELRLLRFEVPARAVAKLYDAGGGTWPAALCDGAGKAICLDVLKSAFTGADVEARVTALTLYASGPVSQSSAQRPGLANAAADAAASLGARQYAAAALAAATPDVPKAELAAHLKKVIALYTACGETVRAAAVLAYAIDTVGPQAKKWKGGASKPTAPAAASAHPLAVRETELATELATAALVRAHARSTR